MPPSSSDEEDFMSDAFLASLESSSSASTSKPPKTYQESRRQALAASQAKNKANALKPYRQREEEARREGMEKNLFERELEKKEGVGKAMGMMMKMGYKVGEGLGKKRAGGEEQVELGDGGSGHGGKVAPVPGEVVDGEEKGEGFFRGGIGSCKRRKVAEPAAVVVEAKEDSKAEASTSGHRFEPVAVSFWAGRKGLGSKAPPPPPPRPTTTSSSTPALDPTAYRSRAAIEYAEKKAEGQLAAARRTVVEMDERENRGFSILHLNPHYIPSFPEPLLQHLTGHAPPSKRAPSSILSPPPPPIESFEAESNAATASLVKRQMEADSLAPILTLEEEEEEVGGMGDAMAGGKKTRTRREEEESEKKDGEVEGGEEEDWEVLAGEARKFILLPATERLAHTLQYLREDFNYCFYCGVEYRSAEELEQDCPGLTEDDH